MSSLLSLFTLLLLSMVWPVLLLMQLWFVFHCGLPLLLTPPGGGMGGGSNRRVSLWTALACHPS